MLAWVVYHTCKFPCCSICLARHVKVKQGHVLVASERMKDPLLPCVRKGPQGVCQAGYQHQ